MTALVQGSDLILSGDVGNFGDEADCFTLADVRAGLTKIGAARKATVRLNSGGGVASEGVAIASLFSAHRGGVEVVVEGVAASAASVAACGAGRVVMSLGSLWMIHEASGLTVGTAEDHAVSIAGLEAVNAGMASIYARKTGKTAQAMAALMAAETWLGADDTVAAGFADAVLGQGAKEPAAFDYQARYKHPPVALIDRRLWAKTHPGRRLPPPPEAARLPVLPPAIPDLDDPLDPVEVAELCCAAEQPEMISAMIRDRVTLATARTRLDVLGQIRPMLALSQGRPGITDDLKAKLLSGRFSVAQARDAVLTAMAEADEALGHIDHMRRTGNGSGGANSREMMRASMEKTIRAQGMEPVKKPKR